MENINDYLKKLVIDKVRHADYERVTDLADKYHTYYTGDGLDDELQQFTPREEPDLFVQRKNITKHIVTSVAWNVTSVEKKLPRSNGITKLIGYDKPDDKKLSELNGALSKFWGTSSWDRFMEVRWVELNDIDPNTFVVFEWGAFDAKKELLQPYPYEVDSYQAVDYEYRNNILQYLTVLNKIVLINAQNPEDNPKEGEKYIVYLPNETVVYTEIWDDSIKALLNDGDEKEINGLTYYRIKERIFEVTRPEPHNLNFVPAFKVGWKRDPMTKGRTYLAPWHAALPFLEKIVKCNSELDLTMALHTFPQKVVTVEKCDDPNCFGGIVTLPDGQETTCKKCGGSGVKFHRSAQDIITVPLPKSGEEQLSLDNMIRYISPPIDLPRFQDEYIDSLTEKCISTVYNSDIFTRSEIATTATEKTISLDNIYDALYPMSVKYAENYKFGVKTIADLIDREEGLIVVFSFSKDFKFKSKDDYIAERKAAIEAEAPAEILGAIDSEIYRIDTADDPDAFAIHQNMKDLNPFEGKRNEEIQYIISARLVPDQQIVLYSSYGFIFDLILLDNPGFWEMNKKKQVEVLYAKVDELIKTMKEERKSTEPPEFE